MTFGGGGLGRREERGENARPSKQRVSWIVVGVMTEKGGEEEEEEVKFKGCLEDGAAEEDGERGTVGSRKVRSIRPAISSRWQFGGDVFSGLSGQLVWFPPTRPG